MLLALSSPLTCTLLLAQQPGPNVRLDPRTNILMGALLITLIASWVIGRALRRQPESTANPAVVRTFNRRIGAWWLMFAVLVLGLIPQGRWGYAATMILFGLVSFWA